MESTLGATDLLWTQPAPPCGTVPLWGWTHWPLRRPQWPLSSRQGSVWRWCVGGGDLYTGKLCHNTKMNIWRWSDGGDDTGQWYHNTTIMYGGDVMEVMWWRWQTTCTQVMLS